MGSAIDVLSEDDITTRQHPFLSDLLRDIPGLAVNRSGPTGAFTQVRLRGAEANHTLIVIDGIEVGDPFNAGEFEFAHLLSGHTSQVEVVRGPQSALWGSEAIGGVINVRTGPAILQDGAWARGLVESGSFGTFLSNAQAGTASGSGYIAAGISYASVQGISASPVGQERDGYENLTATVNAELYVSEFLTLSASARYVDAITEEDAQDFDFLSPTQGLVIDAANARDSERLFARGAGRLDLMGKQWTHEFSVALTDSINESLNRDAFIFGSEGQKWDIEYQTNASFDSGKSLSHNVSALIEYEDLTYEYFSMGVGPENQRQTSHQWSGVVQYRLGINEDIFLGASVRFDDYQRFDNATTYRFTAAWVFPDLEIKVRSSFGTGVAQPSFFELFGFNPNFFIGNPFLQPETSQGWDVGLDYTFANGRGLLSATYFDSNLKKEIFTDFTVFPFTAANRLGASMRDGLEFSLKLMPADGASLAASYSYIDARDDNGLRELRRPKQQGSINVAYQFLDDRAGLDFGVNYNGVMLDREFILATPKTIVTLGDYILGSLAVSYAVSEKVQVVGRVENLFDYSYQEVFGFASPGIGVYAGVRIGLNSG